MPIEFPTLESTVPAIDDSTVNLARNILTSFLATHGESCAQRFQQDETFQRFLWDECLRSLGVLVALMSWWDDSVTTKGIAVNTIANAIHDPPEVASLRVFTVRNMMPKEALDEPETGRRMNWFLDEYHKSRGELTMALGH